MTLERRNMTADELDAMPEGDAVVMTSGGVLWMKGDGPMWIKPLRYNDVKVRSSEWLAQCNPLTVVWDGRDHPFPERRKQ